MKPRLGVNSTLALVAFAAGALALFGDPSGGTTVTIDTRELASIIDGKDDHVTAPELAGWVIEGRADYRLIDVREPSEYVRYHIPTAENVPLAELMDYRLLRNEKIVLYSGGGIHAAQAWMLLRALGYPGVYTVLGGLDAWTDEVLFPSPPPESDPEALAAFERAKQVSLHFGGKPRDGADAALAEAGFVMPEVAAPTAPPPARKKKRKKGC